MPLLQFPLVACVAAPSFKLLDMEFEDAKVKNAVIVGGGLGGLAAAIQLRKRGIDAQVYEKNSIISGGEGTLISLFPNGCRALFEGSPELVTKMRREGIADSKSSIVPPDASFQLGEWSLSSQMEQKYGHPMIAIMWKHALRILSEELPDACKHTGYQCVGVSQEEDGSVAHFTKGEEHYSVKAPLIIGADGIRSTVRSSLFGPIAPRDNGRTMWRAVIDSSLCQNKVLNSTGATTSAANGRTVFIVNGVHGKLYWALSVTDEATNGDTARRSTNTLEMKERLLEYYKGWSLATQIVEATEPGLILERRVVDLPVLEKWSKGSTVLLGDAVHAVTPALGQGANMAFEDGLELAMQVSSCSNLQSALEAYQARRIPRAKEISAASQRQLQSQEFYDWLYSQ
ncbi:hypothetical protein SELMODRAFT_430979 [Selaginella moellendorffii]|uniref:FAD-binding domain-containing protein n=1 Tax=Selaginella moellendorffii TaxID=88036 RepID=D8TB50_SELML|nr:uncharacterized protein LOC9645780 [Selaginella moellendorffii]EFJ06097.1 hypothetical protein SELMODRAFT_430979 [Selaginella moellendorffii]|eukprot:XP_002992807.1 uncharacterized protein LOC9645780 [Selaginella moellendorffii]